MKPVEKKRCPRCGGALRDGVALQNTVSAGAPDFHGDDKDSPGQTLSYAGPAKAVSVWKCTSCGYSRSVSGRIRHHSGSPPESGGR
jgi:hypothetical protein